MAQVASAVVKPTEPASPRANPVADRVEALTTSMAQALSLNPGQVEKVRAINEGAVRSVEHARSRYRQEPAKLRSYVESVSLSRLGAFERRTEPGPVCQVPAEARGENGHPYRARQPEQSDSRPTCRPRRRADILRRGAAVSARRRTTRNGVVQRRPGRQALAPILLITAVAGSCAATGRHAELRNATVRRPG
ncbi:MAG: hypothetical protein WKG07_42540 [Hymenobacter sp.]